MCVDSNLPVLRCSEQKSVPVIDQEVLAHEGMCLPYSLCSHAHRIHTAATFTSQFCFVFFNFLSFLFVFALRWFGEYIFTSRRDV